ncbi:DUF3761 domain-containing protein [Xenorhabdus innexi]|uniref:DUF3761 domain-containing protein n=1 Tax=Xenorhabdus innexi TaxID=290109 RepID=A0A1N6MSW9_9GAMM|nr:DUF3761 domain-containing protein [Xenorhabdus innexi]PHM30151.1 hypothetical protein Xinn_03477 [Xenorhabdus innexi]SIP71920.1 conserved exported hypothetical protein [Xenorhabdus innexi]
MKNLKLSVAALLVLFSSATLAAPAVPTEPVSKPVTPVEKSIKPVKNKIGSLEKKMQKVQKDSKKSTKAKKRKATPTKAVKTALCKDGTYSKSKSRKGACSRHGGVAKWL